MIGNLNLLKHFLSGLYCHRCAGHSHEGTLAKLILIALYYIVLSLLSAVAGHDLLSPYLKLDCVSC